MVGGLVRLRFGLFEGGLAAEFLRELASGARELVD